MKLSFLSSILLVSLLLVSLSTSSAFAVEPGDSVAIPTAPVTIVPAAIVASENQQLEARRKTIEMEQAKVAAERAELDSLREKNARQLKKLDIGEIVLATVEQAELDADAARVDLTGAEVEVQSAREKVDSLQASLATLAARLVVLNSMLATDAEAPGEIAAIDAEVSLEKEYLALEDQHLANLQAARYIASQRLEIARKWAEELRSQYKTARELSDQAALGQLQERLQKEQEVLLTQVTGLRKQLEVATGNSAAAQDTRRTLTTQLLEAEEQAKLKQTELGLAQAQARVNSLKAVLSNSAADTGELDAALKQADALLLELAARATFLATKMDLVRQQQEAIVKGLGVASPDRKKSMADTRVLAQVLDELGKQLKRLGFLRETVAEQRDRLKAVREQGLRTDLMMRQTLPVDLGTWRTLLGELISLPVALWQTTVGQIAAAGRSSNKSDLALLVSLEAIWLILMLFAQRFLGTRITTEHLPQSTFLERLLHLASRLLRTNILSIALIGMLFILLVLTGRPQPGFTLFIMFALIFLSYKIAIDLAQILLLDVEFTQGATHPRVYRAVRWGILAIAILTPLMLLGHLPSAPSELHNFTDRLFMLLLIPVLIMILRGRDLLMVPLRRSMSARWVAISARIIVVLALTLLVSAVTGVAGFVNLAWSLTLYVGLFLLVLGGWLLLRGVLQDVVRLIRNSLETRYGVEPRRPLLENLIEPLARIAQVLLFVLAWAVLFRVYGWDADSPVVRDIRQLMLAPLFTIDDRPITAWSILLTLLIIVAVIRVGSWSRELTYRWLFFRIANSGARHSLSVFTQYAVVLIGFLIALRVLGIDLTTLTVFAGALGVGIGFGLQNIANNFISGILLLIERPVRTGDTVTIGANEGTVTRIGIRSLTVQTVNNLEVIIPNAEVISNPFTNWTFSDTVVRTSFIIAITYQNDLHLARRLIMDVFRAQPGIIRPEQAQVWLEDFGAANIILRIQYFTDTGNSNSQQIKSELLFRIWDSFGQAEIHFPCPPEYALLPPRPAPDAA